MKSSLGRFLLAVAAAVCLPPGARIVAQEAQLRILVVQGQDALNNIRLSANRDVIVEVQDQNRRPVMGAEVRFTLPNQGAGGTFPDGGLTLLATTDAEGRAAARGIRPNGETGPMQIRVTASYLGVSASASVTQTNVAISPGSTNAGAGSQKGGMSTGEKVLLVIAIAAGVAAGAVFATRGDDSPGRGPSGQPPLVITPGTPSVGGPQ